MKYYTVRLRIKNSENATYHGYASSPEIAALKAVDSLPRDIPADNIQVISTTEHGFTIGDRVVTSGHEIIDDEPGIVIGYANDEGWVIVEWAQFNYVKEFHWTVLAKVIE